MAEKKESKFDKDLKYGNIFENQVHNVLVNSKIEMKCERDRWMNTKNVFIEYECYGKPSGVCKESTKSAYWIHGLDLGDNQKVRVGAGDDLQIYHDASNSHITNDYGVLYIDQRVNDGNLNLRSDDGSGGLATYVTLDGGTGAVNLKHYGTTKLATASGGVSVTGVLDVSSTLTSGDITIDVDDTPSLHFKKQSAADILASINVSTDAGSGGKFVIQTKRNGNTALDRFTIDDDGNVGIGVTPEAWSGMTPALTLGDYGSSIATWGSNRNMYLMSNAYYDSGGWKYATTGGAAFYQISGEDQVHSWHIASSGSADAGITFSEKMRIASNGSVGINQLKK